MKFKGKRKLEGNHERLIVQDPQSTVATSRNHPGKLLVFRSPGGSRKQGMFKRLQGSEEESAEMRDWRGECICFYNQVPWSACSKAKMGSTMCLSAERKQASNSLKFL